MDMSNFTPEQVGLFREMWKNSKFRETISMPEDENDPISPTPPAADLQAESAERKAMPPPALPRPRQHLQAPELDHSPAPKSKSIQPPKIRPSRPLLGPRNNGSQSKSRGPSKPISQETGTTQVIKRPQKPPTHSPIKISRPQVPAIKKLTPLPQKAIPATNQARLVKSIPQALSMVQQEDVSSKMRPEISVKNDERKTMNTNSRQEKSSRTTSSSKHSSATPTPGTLQRARPTERSQEQEDDDFLPNPRVYRTPRRPEREDSLELEEIDADLRARRNIPRVSNRPRPQYTTGEEEYLKIVEEQEEEAEERPSKALTSRVYTDPRPSLSSRTARDIGFEDEMDVQELDFATREQPRKVVVGIDYGTTFTSVSYLVCPDEASTTRVFPHEIGTVSDWPSDNMCGASMQVPTELWYSSIPKMRDPRTGRLELSDSETEEDSDELDEEDDDIPRFSTKKPALDPFRIIRGSAPPPASCQNSEASSEDLWGYECPYQKYCAHSTRSKDRYVERPKLMLLTSEHTRADRERLGPILQHLIDKRNIRKYGKAGSRPGARDIQDVVLDFFVPVLLHTRRELIKRDRYTDDCHVLFALTVPINWQPRSSRILQLALEEAIRLTGFGTLKDRSVTNLFVVSEPKAAATYLLGLGHARDLQSGDTFVVLDCGGGTVDGSSYSIAKSASLRLGEEICDPSGHNCGASYLNENFRKLVQYRLKEETYLEGNGNTLDSFVDDVMVRFETYEKRNKDIMGRPSTQIKIPGLKARRPRTLPGNTPEKYQDNYLLLFVDDFKQIFLPVLKDVAKILDAQLEAVIDMGKEPTKVFLIGGFAGAVSMRSFLKDHLAKFISDRNLPYSIDLILPSAQECIKAVSAGAVMQALHPEEGTVRDFVSSYGFFVKEFYTPEAPGHMNAKPIYDEYDGHRYVGIIDYFVMKGDVISPKHRFKRFKYTHVFDVECRRLRCEEVLYVSYKTVANGYPLDHRHNRDAQEEDKITTDFTFLRDEHKIEPVPACVSWDGTVREEHYSITYELVPYLDGRDLKYEAWYPSVKYGQRLKQKQICIASALHPGTV